MILASSKSSLSQAGDVGNAFHIPLGLSKSDVKLDETLHSGSQGSVSKGIWEGQAVAAKKAKISTNADMSRFRIETQLLLLLGKHKNIVPLIAARLLPPGQHILS